MKSFLNSVKTVSNVIALVVRYIGFIVVVIDILNYAVTAVNAYVDSHGSQSSNPSTNDNKEAV